MGDLLDKYTDFFYPSDRDYLYIMRPTG